MLKNYFKIALRNFQKYKAYSFINIAGLAIGMACCSLILLYVQKEISYDNYHPDVDRLYRVAILKGVSTINQGQASVSYPTSEMMLQDYPEVEAAARIFQVPMDAVVSREDQQFTEKQLFFAEKNIFELFHIPFLKGSAETAFQERNTIVLSEASAQKYFGSTDAAMGQILTANINNFSNDFKVTGIVQNPPENTHFKYGLLADFEAFRSYFANPDRFLTTWFLYRFWTYVKLAEGYDYQNLEAKFPQFIKTYFPETRQDNALFLQPVKDIHLTSHLENEFEANNDILYVYIFSAIAFLVLLIACINFMNLATARSINRAKEVGMRKVMGAYRGQLIKQFLAESLFTSLVAVVFSLGLIELFLLAFNALSGKDLSLNYLQNGYFILGFLGLAIFAGLFAGLYPAIFLSSFQPVKTLKGAFTGTAAGRGLRKSLVTLQMAITVVLLVSIIVINQQLNYVHDKKLGFTDEQMLLIEPRGSTLMNQETFESFKNTVLQLPEVQGITRNSRVMGQDFPIRSIFPNNIINEDEKMVTPFVFVGEDYATVYDLEIIEGRDFSAAFTGDGEAAYILNESAVKTFGLIDPIGKEMSTGDRTSRPGKIIGVVKDFHFASLHQEIDPLVIGKIDAFGYRYISVRMQSNSLSESIAKVEGIWQQFESLRPMTFSFLDDQLNQVYQFEAQLGDIITYFTGLAIFIACLGLFGMASFAAEQRTKEIGIRKVLGASVRSIILSFSAEFVKMALIANLIAWPLAYYAINTWLHRFAYRIDISLEAFLTAGCAALLITIMTVSYQAVKAAFTNPVDALKYE